MYLLTHLQFIPLSRDTGRQMLLQSLVPLLLLMKKESALPLLLPEVEPDLIDVRARRP